MTNTSISIEVNKILQMVHDDAVKKNHDKLLGFSSRATERILDLIQKEREEAYTEGAEDFAYYLDSPEVNGELDDAAQRKFYYWAWVLQKPKEYLLEKGSK